MTSTPEKPTQQVSARMKLVKRSGSKIEKVMASILRKKKLRYRRQVILIGHPDFELVDKKVLIFCDSSFWHGRRMNELNETAFTRNKEFWMKKLTDNKKRDMRTNRALRKQGWKVLRFWDTDILKKPQKVIRKLDREIS